MKFEQGFSPFHLNIKGELRTFSQPVVMGILNITEDSFYDGGNYLNLDNMLVQVEKMLNEGAQIIDIGASSSRPGSIPVELEVEKERVNVAINKIHSRFPDALLSIDTFRADVAETAIGAGAHIVNDISAGDDDPNMLKTVAKLGVPYIAMHKQGSTQNMQKAPAYSDVLTEVTTYLGIKKKECSELGIKDFIADPGFGFGKSVEHNYSLFSGLPYMLKMLETPILVGVSRKSMITRLMDVSPDKALNGSTALHMAALIKGASILRVHDVKEATEVVKIYHQL